MGVHAEDWPMARKAACLPKGTRISDYVTLGVLTATVPGELTGQSGERVRDNGVRF
jgi:hypothetical protein